VAVQRHLAQGQVALESGAWRAARGAFEAALAAAESAEALEGLGAAAWWLDDGDTVFRVRERAYELYRRRAEHAAAARLATELAEDHLFFRGEPAVARGWLKRAQRLLDGLPLCAEHGWLALIEGDLAMSLDNDPTIALARAVAAGKIAHRLKLVDLQMLALSLEGLALVSAGNVTDGMPCLDEAAAAALSGEMRDLLAIGYTCCYLITACERARDFERAAQWCNRVNSFCERTQFSTLFSICRVQYASVLVWRGEWTEAETELRAAVSHLALGHPGPHLEGLVRLAELLRRQGRTHEVTALLKQAADHPRSLLERAALALDRDDAEAAAQFAQRFLRQTPTENRVDRLPALDVLLRAELARGNRKSADNVLSEIQTAAAGVSTTALRAGARLAEGLVAAAAGEHVSAGTAFEDAIDLYTRSGAQFEKARACMELARVLFARGREDDARHEAGTALDIFQHLGAERERRVAEALLRPALEATSPSSPLTRRELEVVRLLAEGLSNSTIARQLGVSEFTVKRHVANILTKLDLPTRAAAAAYAAREGLS
jgi:DNA-binding NarL/FixJ family response regulator